MEWYVSIAILPGVGMLILSSSSQVVAVSDELKELLGKRCTTFQHRIAQLKIAQLGRVTRATNLLYLSAALFVLSGLIGVFDRQEKVLDLSDYVLITGVVLVLIALILLIDYSFKTIRVRKLQHTHNKPLDDDTLK